MLDNEDHMFYPKLNPTESLLLATELKTHLKMWKVIQTVSLEKPWYLGLKPDWKVMLAGYGTQGETENWTWEEKEAQHLLAIMSFIAHYFVVGIANVQTYPASSINAK